MEIKVIGGIGERKSNGGTQWYQQNRIYFGDKAIAVATSFNPYYCIMKKEAHQGSGNLICTDFDVRRLTPRECFRLMGVKDEDFDRIKDDFSDSALYHMAGDSIVTSCLMSIFGTMAEEKQSRAEKLEMKKRRFKKERRRNNGS